MRILFVPFALAALASCGSSTANGVVAKACVAAGRQSASAQLCSCVQQAANRTLNGSDQALAATFFADPQKAQDIRQAETPTTSAFWARYRRFSDTASSMCG